MTIHQLVFESILDSHTSPDIFLLNVIQDIRTGNIPKYFADLIFDCYMNIIYR